LGVPIDGAGRASKLDVAFFPRLLGLLHAQRPHVVHAHLHAGKYAGRLGAVLTGVPAIVFTEHGDELRGPLNTVANRFLNPRTSRFITFSEPQRRRLAAAEGIALERISVIPNGVAAPPAAERATVRRELGLADDTSALYLPARMTAQKNHLVVVRALAQLRRNDPRLRLVLAGTGPLESAIRAEVATLGLSDAVDFLGFRDDAARLCRGMDVFVLPSRWESMPVALGEAMRAGLPVVTTPWPGVEEFVDDGITGFIASDATPEAFAVAILRTQNDALRRAVAARGKAYADERFDPDAMVRRHLDLYQSLRVAPA
jgi:glycosyltransferase involved in cell wall biosynthesis